MPTTSRRRDTEPEPPAILSAYRGALNGRPGWYLEIASDPLFRERLRARIPLGQRWWMAVTGQWWIAADAELALLRILPAFERWLAQQELGL